MNNVEMLKKMVEKNKEENDVLKVARKVLKKIPKCWKIERYTEHAFNGAKARVMLEGGSLSDVGKRMKVMPCVPMVRRKLGCLSHCPVSALKERDKENVEVWPIAPFIICGDYFNKKVFVRWYSIVQKGIMVQLEFPLLDGSVKYEEKDVTEVDPVTGREKVVGKSYYLMADFSGQHFDHFVGGDGVVCWPYPDMKWNDVVKRQGVN